MASYNIRYRKEDIDKINSVYQGIISYIDQFVKDNNIRSTSFSIWLGHFVGGDGNRCFNLEIKGKSIKLVLNTDYYYNNKKKKFDMRKVNDISQQLEIINNYNAICTGLSHCAEDTRKIKRYIQEEKESNSAKLAVQFPESIDQHAIEVKEEDGRVVGIIDFGGKLIKIVTDGNIVLEDQRGKSKTKEK